jgi:hypothetical protein
MSIRSSLIIGVVAATAVGSPAFAQAWSNGWGTGNSQPGYFDKDGGMHSGNAPQQLQAVTPGRGLYAFAGHNVGLPDSQAFGIIAARTNPAPTARGGIGHNQMLKSDQS